MEFEIPMDDKELLGTDFVKEDLDIDDIPQNLKDLSDVWRQNEEGVNAADFLDHFDAFFACISQWSELESPVKIEAWKLSGKSLDSQYLPLMDYLQRIFSEGGGESKERIAYQNLFCANIYCFCRIFDLLQSDLIRDSKSELNTAGGKARAKKAQKSGSRLDLDWSRHRMEFLTQVEKFLKLTAVFQQKSGQNSTGNILRLLWEAGQVPDSFANLLTNTLIKVLEDADVAKVAGRCTFEKVADILGVALRDFANSKGVAVRISSLLQEYQYEQLGQILGELVASVVRNYPVGGAPELIGQCLREVGQLDGSDFAREGCAKATQTFLVSLAQHCPGQLYPCVSYVAPHLDGDSATVRMGLLTVFAELASDFLGQEQCSDDQKRNRLNYLYKIKDHIHDTNAHARAKCISLFHAMADRNRLPLQFLKDGTLLEDVAGRLNDKSSIVRQRAFQLLTRLLKRNPYKYKLNLAELQHELGSLEGELIRLQLEHPGWDGTRRMKRALEWWQGKEELLKEVLEKVLDEFVKTPAKAEKEGDDSETTETKMETVAEENLPNKEDWSQRLYCSIFDDETEEMGSIFLEILKNTKEFSVELVTNSRAEFADKFVGRVKEDCQGRFVTDFINGDITDQPENVDKEDQDRLEQDADNAHERRLKEISNTVVYLKDSIMFASKLDKFLTQATKLFGSSQSTDVVEAVEFVTTCSEFKVPGTEKAVKKICNLIARKDPVIKEAVVKSFKRLFLVDTAQDAQFERQSLAVAHRTVARNLLELTKGADESELASLEELICAMAAQNAIHLDVLNILWHHFSMDIPDASREDSRAAIQILGMVGKADKRILSEKFDQLVDDGLSDVHASKDFAFARDVCQAVCKLARKVDLRNETTLKEEPCRFLSNHKFFFRIEKLLVDGFSKFDDRYWTPFMESGIDVFFSLAENPDKLATNLLEKCLSRTLAAMETGDKKDVEYVEQENGNEKNAEEANSDVDSQAKDENKAAEWKLSLDANTRDLYLSRLFALLGHVALRVLIFVDVSYVCEMKRRSLLSDLANKSARKSLGADADRSDRSFGDFGDDDMGLTGAVAEDLEQEEAARILRDEVLGEESPLSGPLPLLVHCLDNYAKYSHRVQSAAAIALAKIMLINESFCQRHLRLFFKLLRQSPTASVRSNLMIAAGDLCFRFPNLVEPFSKHLYDRLSDDDESVKQTCLLVLTHLILNDMIKCKGYVADIAYCTLDKRNHMAGLAKRFFVELAQKGNTVYNLMPDIISRLSDGDSRLSPVQFQDVMRFLFQFIRKDRQCESLVEKLCQRFQAAKVTDESSAIVQWRYLSFCLSQLQYHDKALEKLRDNAFCYLNKLRDEEVWRNFQTILANARKNAKGPEMKAEIDEIEEKFERLHDEGAENEEAAERAVRLLAGGSKRTPRKSPRKKLKLDVSPT